MLKDIIKFKLIYFFIINNSFIYFINANFFFTKRRLAIFLQCIIKSNHIQTFTIVEPSPSLLHLKSQANGSQAPLVYHQISISFVVALKYDAQVRTLRFLFQHVLRRVE